MTKEQVYQNLRSRLQEVKAAGKKPVAVFDLDATLFDVGPRVCRILQEYAVQHDHFGLQKALKSYRRTELPYLLKDILAELGFPSEELLEDVSSFWFDRFFTDHYQYYDTPLSGGVKLVHELYAEGACIVYLTGRDAPGMLVGCTESLRRNGFPVGVVNTVMLLKPDFDTPDPVFKEEATRFINGLGEVFVSFDNEPGNCKIFQDTWPTAVNVFMDTQRASAAELPPDGMPALKDFLF